MIAISHFLKLPAIRNGFKLRPRASKQDQALFSTILKHPRLIIKIGIYLKEAFIQVYM